MARYVYSSITLPSAGVSGTVVGYDRPSNGQQYSDMFRVAANGTDTGTQLPNGTISSNGSGTDLGTWVGPDEVTSMWLQFNSVTPRILAQASWPLAGSPADMPVFQGQMAIAIAANPGPPGPKGDPGTNGVANASYGSASVGSMLLGATQNIVVTISPAQPDTSYTPIVTFSGTALLGTASYAVTAQSTTTVTVAVKAGIAVSTGGTINVAALR